MENLRQKHLTFLNFLRKKTGLSNSALAKRAGISDSTLTRFVNKPSFESLSSSTLDKISKVAGYESYESYLLEESEQGKRRKKIEICDATKFETYESVKRLLVGKYGSAKPDLVKDISQKVFENAATLNTDFITDSLIMYVIEKEELNSV